MGRRVAGVPLWQWGLTVGLVVVGVVAFGLVQLFGDSATDVEDSASPSTTSVAATDDPYTVQAAAEGTCSGAVKKLLTDPGSAQFRDWRVTPSGGVWQVTAEVNARNQFGGMAGYRGFTCVLTYDAAADQFHGEATLP